MSPTDSDASTSVSLFECSCGSESGDERLRFRLFELDDERAGPLAVLGAGELLRDASPVVESSAISSFSVSSVESLVELSFSSVLASVGVLARLG